jgi:hypothetical protein
VSATVDTSTSTSEDAAVDNTPPETPEAPKRPAIKPGKQPPEEIRKIVEANLALGQRVSKKELADLIGKTSEAVRQRRDTGRLPEWGIQLVPGSRPEEFERI